MAVITLSRSQSIGSQPSFTPPQTPTKGRVKQYFQCVRISLISLIFLTGFYAGGRMQNPDFRKDRLMLGCDDDHHQVHGQTPAGKVEICNDNPYRRSLLKGHSFELAEQKAQLWMTNKTNIRDAMYFKSYGKHTHDKFDAFEVMAPCHYSCTGECRADTSKIVCGADTLQPGCIIYSIGGNNNWEFEEKIYDMTPCQIHTFDCTGPIGRFRPPTRIRDRHRFHHICLAADNIPAVARPELVKHEAPDFGVVGAMNTLQTIQKRLNHTRLDLLKLDIEGYEWKIFPSWPELADLEASRKVSLPMQILIEVHYRTAMHELWPKKGEIFKDEIDIVEFQAHLLRMGYVVAYRDDNMLCPHCTELTLLRHKCIA